MKSFVWGLVLLLVVLHQDFWNWDNDRWCSGFLPVTLAYHAGISLAAGVVWFLATSCLAGELEDDAVGRRPSPRRTHV